MKINLSDLSGRKNIKIKSSKLCILCTQVRNMRWLSNPVKPSQQASQHGIVWVQKLKTTQYKACERDTPQTPNLNKRKRDFYEKKNE